MLKKIRGDRFFRRPLYRLLDELIGEEIEVARARNKLLIGIKGRILFETKDAFLIDTGSKRLRVPKRGTEFEFPRLGLRVKGEVLYIDPARRTKLLDLRRR